MKWGLLFHIYQPPNQRLDIIDLVTRESYEPLLDVLIRSQVPITLNVTSTLLEQLVNNDRWPVIDKLRTLFHLPNITLTNSAYSHALLPLWPEEEINHQLERNKEVVRNIINQDFNPDGLYLPECAYSNALDGPIKKARHQWVLLDEISLIRQNYIAAGKKRGIKTKYLFRKRDLSQALPTSLESFEKNYSSLESPAIVALDGEAFGHFDTRSIVLLEKVLAKHGSELISLSDLADEAEDSVITRSGTWETSAKDLQRQIAFPLWQDKNNNIHKVMWKYYRKVHQELHKSKGLDSNEWVRIHFDNSISSCWWWWANTKRTAGPFKMKAWNPDMIVIGLSESIKAVRSDANISPKIKWKLETDHANLLKLIWQTHWKINS